MAGIYIHIPFCRSKCAYCDFYSVANTNLIERFVEVLLKEIEIQQNYLEHEIIQTIYFGGGTPSTLSVNQIQKILIQIHTFYKVDKNCELTLEANPDDLSFNYLKAIKSIGINRLSVGVQSFNNRDLLLMKRKHSVNQAVTAIRDAQVLGFENISIDLIYGLPDLSLKKWEKNITEALNLKVQHISAYHLTIEKNTLFYKYYKNQKLNLPSDDESLDQFKLLKAKTAKKGFLHYELSNFAVDGFISLHNTNYWMGVKYLGLGPSAHSYNLSSRQWNIQNLRVYMDEILQGKLPYETEILTETEKYNDFIITSLRTMWGLNTEKLKMEFGKKYQNHFMEISKKMFDKNFLVKENKNFILSAESLFISDNIIRDFLYD